MFKKLILVFLCSLVVTASAFAEGTVTQKHFMNSYYEDYGKDMKIAVFTITDDSGSVPLTAFLNPTEIKGWYIMTVEVDSGTDDSLNVLIETAYGTDLFNGAFTGASSGEIKSTDDRYPITSTPKIDVTNMSGDTVTVVVTFVR